MTTFPFDRWELADIQGLGPVMAVSPYGAWVRYEDCCKAIAQIAHLLHMHEGYSMEAALVFANDMAREWPRSLPPEN